MKVWRTVCDHCGASSREVSDKDATIEDSRVGPAREYRIMTGVLLDDTVDAVPLDVRVTVGNQTRGLYPDLCDSCVATILQGAVDELMARSGS